MKVILDNRIRFKTASVPKSILRAIKEKFQYPNPEFFKRQAMGYWTGGTPRIIATWSLEAHGEWFTIPRGGLARFLDLLVEVGLTPVIDDRRYAGPLVEYQLEPDFVWRDYQREAIDKILQAETCLIEGGPASGKSEILLGAIHDAGVKAGIMVNDKKLMRQWLGRIEKRLGFTNRRIGKVGGGYKFRIGEEITVMMQQTARKRIDDLYDQFGFVGQDECHHASAPTFLETLDMFTSRFKVGASATIKRRDLRHFLVHDQFGEIVFSIDRQELVDRGYTTDVELVIVPSRFSMDYLHEDALQDLDDRGVIDLEDLNYAERMKVAEEMGWEPAIYPHYLNAVAIDPDRNNLIYRVVKHEVDQGSRVVIFTKRRYHCELFRKKLARVGIEVAIFWGSGGDRVEDDLMEDDMKRVRAGKIRVAIGNTIDEGIDFPVVDVGVITYRNAKNPGQLTQQAGRLARLFKGKKRSRLYYIHDGRISRFKGDISTLKKHFKTVTVQAFPKRVKKLAKRK